MLYVLEMGVGTHCVTLWLADTDNEFFFLFLVYQEFRWRVGNTNSAGCLCQVDLLQQKLVLNVFHGQLCSPSEEDLRGKSFHERGKNKDNQA